MSEDLLTRVQTEADQCRNDGADDIARLLDEVAAEVKALRSRAVPASMALVPVEPTIQMQVAGFESEAWDALSDAVLAKKGWPYSCRQSAECVSAIWRAMLGAAPGSSSPAPAPATAGLRKAAQDVLDRWNSPKWEWAKQGPTADLMVKLREELEASPAPAVAHQAASSWMWTHKVKGGEYRMLGEALLQCDVPLTDMDRVVVYQGEDGRIWVRDGSEWDDRFTRLPKLAASQPPVQPMGDGNG